MKGNLGNVVFSLVIPAHNEAKQLPAAVAAAVGALDGINFEIIIAEDGSSDGSLAVAEALAKKDARVRVSHSDEKLGRGRALCRAFHMARGEIVGYMDADLSTEPKYLKALVAAAREADYVTGGRYLPASSTARGAKRYAFSKGFNWLVRLLLGSKLGDHQCGFKAIRRSEALELCALARENHWFWDTETLVLSQRRGKKVIEIPVEWRESTRESKVNLLKDALSMGSAIARMRLRRY
ncbi:hypothetical protein AUJ14_02610 [Candidatus Micrarchaeota archaeon CG1_02_55_22]|nr:MAG: hypothetical protein AUJ14_02610 [Candidatus Micrarchaeota archaeon CG1_02_55_22]